MKITALLFDLDHTLGFDQHLEAKVLHSLAQTHHLPFSEDCLQFFLKQFQSGKISLKELFLNVFQEKTAPTVEKLKEEYRQICLKEAPICTKTIPGAKELFNFLLGNKIPFAIFSNGWKKLQEAKAKAIGFPNRVLTSEEIGKWKPNPEAFQEAVTRLGYSLESTLYIGDSPENDVAGAKNAGMPACWFNPEHKNYPENLPKPDFILHALEELCQLVLLILS